MGTKEIMTIRLKELRAEREKRLNEGLQSGRLVVRFNHNGRLVVVPREPVLEDKYQQEVP